MNESHMIITENQFISLMEEVTIEHLNGVVGVASKKGASLYVAVIGFGYMEELRKKIFGMKGNP